MPKEKSPAIKKKLAKKGLSQLNRECSLDAFKHNLRREYHAGQTAQGTQHVAIALSVLKRSCGVDSKDRMTPKEIVAMGGKKTMNVESINALLVKAIGQIQEQELSGLIEAKRIPGRMYPIGKQDKQIPLFSDAVTRHFTQKTKTIVKNILRAAEITHKTNIHSAPNILQKYAKKTGNITTELAKKIAKGMTGKEILGIYDPENLMEPEVAAYHIAKQIQDYIQQNAKGSWTDRNIFSQFEKE
jgi:hypothetical protein